MPAMQSHDFLTPVLGNAFLNPNCILTVSLVASLTSNLPITVFTKVAKTVQDIRSDRD